MHPDYLTRAELFAQGFTRRSIAAAVRAGELIHVRRDRYLPAGAAAKVEWAVRVGGRLTCLSLLSHMGVFVLADHGLHVHVDPGASRLRAPRDRTSRIDARHRHGVRLHWSNLVETPSSSTVVHVIDALIHAVRCQPPRAAIATLDSALHLGLIREHELSDVFAALPPRFQVLRKFVDGRAESGPETLVRLMARSLECEIGLQVTFDGVGRVDLLLDGWLVIECDSKKFHASWRDQVRDRERDLRLAALGYTTLRLPAATIMHSPDAALAALRGLVHSRRPAA